MPFDANLVLRGPYLGTYADLVTADTAATTTTAESGTGNAVVDLGEKGTGALGMDCVVIMHDQATGYTKTCTIVIQDSDHYDAGFHALLTFPIVYVAMYEIVATATVAFDGSSDLDQTLTAGGASDGTTRAFSRKLLTIGGVGKIFVEDQDGGDIYDTENDSLTSGGNGRATQVGIGRIPNWVTGGLTMVRRFSTSRRYIRCSITVDSTGNFGDVDILVTGSQHNFVDNLYL